LIYRNPSEIPQNYYTEIKSFVSKPIIFTEIGWSAQSQIKGWESDQKEQAEFVSTFFKLTKGLNAEVMVWSFMYD